jgi:hypothetical protein
LNLPVRPKLLGSQDSIGAAEPGLKVGDGRFLWVEGIGLVNDAAHPDPRA